MLNTPTLTSDRLIIRKFTEDDREPFLDIFGDRDVNTHLPWFPLQSLEDAATFYQNRYERVYLQPRGYAYAICLKKDDIPIGYVNVTMDDSHDLGYGLKKVYWGQGIVSEACRMVVNQVKRDGLPYVTATRDVHNPRGAAVMKKIGMRYQYSYVEHWQPKGIWVVFRMYQLHFDGHDESVYTAYWDAHPIHFVEAGI
ncbi:MAG: GNAT family N-acetyltransferase [Sphaerochaeta sp.]|jgi:RimJ/RimL family protein N-acetyltransferase|nr:GNAT family N-acetyltransferase [Sphaerochaeta sp.]